MAHPPENCPSCGARVDAVQRDAAFVYACKFCSAHISIDPLVTRAPAPQLFVQAPTIRVNPKTVAKAGAGLGCFITVMALLPVVIGVGIALKPLLSGLFSSHFGDFPIDVAMNDSVEIDDRTATGQGTMVTVGVNGKLTLRRCHLQGPLIVKAAVNAEITIVDSTLQGTTGIIEAGTNLKLKIENSTLTSGEEIVDAPVNATIDVSKGSKITAAGVAFPMEVNATISIDGSSVEGTIGAIACKNVGHVKVTGNAVVKSNGIAIELDQSGNVAISNSRVEGKEIALEMHNNAEGTLRSATLVGGKESVSLGVNGKLVVAGSSLTGAKKVGTNSKIDER